MNRPGPDALAPGRAPDGVVLHVYDAAGVLVLARAMRPDDDVEAIGLADAAAVAGAELPPGPVVLVVFDGDTGERHPSWVGVEPGTRLAPEVIPVREPDDPRR